MPQETPGFPREISPGIFWLGYCYEAVVAGKSFHNHLGQFLLIGSERTLLIDTGASSIWSDIHVQLETALNGRDLDYVFPTHPEMPHASALPLVLKNYPRASVVGDMRDYHLYFPEYSDRLMEHSEGHQLDLGELKLVFVEAIMKDLPNTLWAYEPSRKIMFVADGFAFAHDTPGMPDHDEAIHRPGDCVLMTSELGAGVDVDKASFILRAALYWSRFVDVDAMFADLLALLEKYPSRMIAPAHGNVIDDLDAVLPVMRRAHEQAVERVGAGSFTER